MLEEVQDLSPDLRSKKISEKEKDSIFRPKQKKLEKDEDLSR